MLRDRYLNLVEVILTGMILEDAPLQTESYRTFFKGMSKEIFDVDEPVESEYGKFQTTIREYGWDWPSQAFTMIGMKRLRNFRQLIEQALAGGVQGDIIETGVWRGGASIMAKAVLAAYGVTDRKVIVADSFEGLPPPDEAAFPSDKGSVLHTFAELAVSLEQVRENFRRFDLLDDQVLFLKGWFRDTMPRVPSERLAIIRLDGDMYESTIDPLRHLYDRLSIGGWIIVDDYGVVPGCKAAVHDFLDERSITANIRPIDGMGVYFQKTSA